MRGRLVTLLLVAGALALAVPAVTLASGGGSAGDQQYTDPFAGSTTPTSASHTTTSAPPTSTAAPTTTSAPPPTATVAPASTTTPATAADPTTPTATTAQLPYTGYDGWVAGLCGFALVSGGLVLRHRVRGTQAGR
jgi:hypothetical protein